MLTLARMFARFCFHVWPFALLVLWTPVVLAVSRPCEYPPQVHLLAAAATMEAHAPRLAQLCAPRAGKVYHYYCADDEALASGRQEVGRK